MGIVAFFREYISQIRAPCNNKHPHRIGNRPMYGKGACIGKKKRIAKIEKGWLENLTFSEFARRIAEFYNDVNYIHPFREGNGRTERIYFTQLIRSLGYDINFSDIDTSELMIATIQASQGVLDFLIDFFENSIISSD